MATVAVTTCMLHCLHVIIILSPISEIVIHFCHDSWAKYGYKTLLFMVKQNLPHLPLGMDMLQ